MQLLQRPMGHVCADNMEISLSLSLLAWFNRLLNSEICSIQTPSQAEKCCYLVTACTY